MAADVAAEERPLAEAAASASAAVVRPVEWPPWAVEDLRIPAEDAAVFGEWSGVTGARLGVGRFLLQRFWWCRKGEAARATKSVEQFVKLAGQYGLADVSLDAAVEAELRTGKFFWVRATHTTPALLGVHARLHLPADFSTAQTMRTVWVVLSYLLADEAATRNGVVFLLNAQGFSWSNFSLETERAFLTALQGALPIRYPALYVVDGPLIVRALITLLWPILGQKLRDRIRVVESGKLTESLPAHMIPRPWGGALPSDDLDALIEPLRRDLRQYGTAAQADAAVAAGWTRTFTAPAATITLDDVAIPATPMPPQLRDGPAIGVPAADLVDCAAERPIDVLS